MELLIRNSFYRDWDNISSKELSNTIQVLLNSIKKAQDISQIPHLKKLRKFELRYKIELKVQQKIYWIFCIVKVKRIEFVRIKSETFFKKNL